MPPINVNKIILFFLFIPIVILFSISPYLPLIYQLPSQVLSVLSNRGCVLWVTSVHPLSFSLHEYDVPQKVFVCCNTITQTRSVIFLQQHI